MATKLKKNKLQQQAQQQKLVQQQQQQQQSQRCINHNHTMQFHQSNAKIRARNSNPIGFRDTIIAGLDRTKGKIEATWKFLNEIAAKLENRLYGEALLDILLVGGVISPDGTLLNDGNMKPRTSYCLFNFSEDPTLLASWENLIVRLIQRFKYLQNIFDAEMRKLITLLKNFDDVGRQCLARYTATSLINGLMTPRTLSALCNKDLISEGLTLKFCLIVFHALKEQSGVPFMLQTIKRAGLDHKMISFMPPKIRSETYLNEIFSENDLVEIVKLHRARAIQELRRQLYQMLIDDLNEEIPQIDILQNVHAFMRENNLTDYEIIGIIFSALISLGEWNTREILVTEQAVRHLQPYCEIFKEFASNERAQVNLMQKIQEYCFDNKNFMKSFEKLILFFYKTGVLHDAAVVRWHDTAYLEKGKDIFLKQLSVFVDWIKSSSDINSRCKYGRMDYLNMSPNQPSTCTNVILPTISAFSDKLKMPLNDKHDSLISLMKPKQKTVNVIQTDNQKSNQTSAISFNIGENSTRSRSSSKSTKSPKSSKIWY